MWGFNPRISAWSIADPMCPPACASSRAKTTLRSAGLTGHLISTLCVWAAGQPLWAAFRASYTTFARAVTHCQRHTTTCHEGRVNANSDNAAKARPGGVWGRPQEPSAYSRSGRSHHSRQLLLPSVAARRIEALRRGSSAAQMLAPSRADSRNVPQTQTQLLDAL